MSNNHFTRGTVIRTTSAKADVGVYRLQRYIDRSTQNILAFDVDHLGEFSSQVEAEHAFFRQYPIGILAEGNRHGVQQMPTRGHAREYAKNFADWQVKDAGVLAGTARWSVVKRAK